MKNAFYTLSVLTVMAAPATAQFGFEGGLNMANLAIKSAGNTVPTKFKAGAAIGIVAGFSLTDANHFYFEPGVFYQMNGAKITSLPTGGYSINSVNIPLNIEYRWGEKCSARFFVGAGPYIADNISASYYFDAYGAIPSSSKDLVIGTDIKKLDYGLGANFGYIGKKHLFFRAHYQVGLNNLYPVGNANNSLKQSSFGLTGGYLFRGCNRGNGRSGFGGGGGDHWRGLKKNRNSRKQYFRRPNGPGY